MAVQILMKRLSGRDVGCSVVMGDIAVGAVSDDAVSALHNASGLAAGIAAEMSKHPALAALMPPQVAVGLKAINMASAAIKSGQFDALAAEAPHAARAVARILKSVF